MELKFRAKLHSHYSDENWYYGLPYLQFAEDINRKEYYKWYLRNYELCVCSESNHMYHKGEVYKSSYSSHIDESTLQVCINGKWEYCSLPDCFTKGYKLI
jgi:hypothetical protein